MKPSYLNMPPQEAFHAIQALGDSAYRADQFADWIWRKGVTDPARMSNIPKRMREHFEILTSSVAKQSESSDGTIKLLLKLHDGLHVETVLIPTARFASACLSTQVGCAMGCPFCATGLDGFVRNLTTGEMLEQILHLQHASGRKVTHVVFMGMGEPLANYDATVGAIRAIVDPLRLGISARHVTVSTVGLPRQIRRLAAEMIPVTLAISLHAPNDALRQRLLPVASRYPLEEILAAAKEFYQARNREITLEYVLLGGINDTGVCADALARFARDLRCSVNLIPYNPVASLPYDRPSKKAVEFFQARLSARGINVHVRRPRGLDADAACGQLRRQVETKK